VKICNRFTTLFKADPQKLDQIPVYIRMNKGEGALRKINENLAPLSKNPKLLKEIAQELKVAGVSTKDVREYFKGCFLMSGANYSKNLKRGLGSFVLGVVTPFLCFTLSSSQAPIKGFEQVAKKLQTPVNFVGGALGMGALVQTGRSGLRRGKGTKKLLELVENLEKPKKIP
jgi:hypothetical protein